MRCIFGQGDRQVECTIGGKCLHLCARGKEKERLRKREGERETGSKLGRGKKSTFLSSFQRGLSTSERKWILSGSSLIPLHTGLTTRPGLNAETQYIQNSLIMMKQLLKKKKDLCRAYSTKSDKQQTNNDANAAKMSSSAELKLIHRECMCCIIKRYFLPLYHFHLHRSSKIHE